jgi:hypothetical protein
MRTQPCAGLADNLGVLRRRVRHAIPGRFVPDNRPRPTLPRA